MLKNGKDHGVVGGSRTLVSLEGAGPLTQNEVPEVGRNAI